MSHASYASSSSSVTKCRTITHFHSPYLVVGINGLRCIPAPSSKDSVGKHHYGASWRISAPEDGAIKTPAASFAATPSKYVILPQPFNFHLLRFNENRRRRRGGRGSDGIANSNRSSKTSTENER